MAARKKTTEQEPKTDEREKSLPLHIKHRPKDWDDVIGQDAAVDALAGIVERRSSHAIILTGPSGCGKTTLARIAAEKLGAMPGEIVEIDAASNSGIDAMRAFTKAADYMPFGESKARALIVDEVHGLSKQAWDSMLKPIEDCPEFTFWFLCTTNLTKVPQTIKTRCSIIQLKLVKEKQLGYLFDDVCETEKIDIPGDAGDLIIREANGSPRQLLVNLELCRDVRNKKEASELLKTIEETGAIGELCRAMMARASWPKLMGLYAELEDENAEGTRIAIVRYFGAVLKGAKNDKSAVGALQIFDAFADSYNDAEGAAPLLRSIARAVF